MDLNVVFKTPLREYKIDPSPFSLPSTVKPAELTEVVKHLLQKEGEELQFDFAVRGKMLQGSLGEHLEREGLSAEQTHEIEFFHRAEGTRTGRSFEHPDWVSDVDFVGKDLFVTTCYDGGVRVWRRGGQGQAGTGDDPRLVVHRPASAMPLKAAAVHVLDSPGDAEEFRIFTVGKDRFARVWHLKAGELLETECFEANASLECVTCSPHGNIACGSWDGSLLLRGSSDEAKDEAELPPRKKRRVASNGGLAVPTSERAPHRTLKCHAGPVTALFWPSEQALYTASNDWSFSLWDPEGGSQLQKWDTPAPISALAYSFSGNCLATAHTNRKLYLWDPRLKARRGAARIFRGHTNSVTDVSFIESSTLLASTGFDGCCKVWDIRADSPLFTLGEQTEQPIKKGLAIASLGKNVLVAMADQVDEYRLA